MAVYNLNAAGGEKPPWLTQEHFDRWELDGELQNRWEPKVGDFYFCSDLYEVLRINNLGSYYDPGLFRLASDRPEGSAAKGGCDYFLPEPKTAQEKTAKPRQSAGKKTAKPRARRHRTA